MIEGFSNTQLFVFITYITTYVCIGMKLSKLLIFQEIQMHSIAPTCAMVLGYHRQDREGASAVLRGEKDQGHLSRWWASRFQVARLELKNESCSALTDCFFLIWMVVGSGQVIRDVLYYVVQAGFKISWAACIYIYLYSSIRCSSRWSV